MWQLIAANASRKVRRATLNGRSYLVTRGTMIVPGVLAGSAGKIYYPAEVLQDSPSDWNGVPIVVDHPTINGTHISARDPDVLNYSGIGYVMRSDYNQKLGAELWFDEQNVKDYDLRNKTDLYKRISKGKITELSTGLTIKTLRAPKGSNYNGKSYDFIAQSMKPDHLAILLKDVGACSVADGCGVHVNKRVENVNANANDSDLVINPFQNEHAARVKDPGQFKEDSFRRKELTSGISAIMGKLKGGSGSMVIQSYRFDKRKFTTAQARKWLRDHSIKPIEFEEAKTTNKKAKVPTMATKARIKWTHVLTRNEMSYEDEMDKIRKAFRAAHPYRQNAGGMTDYENTCYLTATFDDHVVYREGEILYRQYFTKKGGKVEFDDDKTPVEMKVDYVPISSNKKGEIMLSKKERLAVIANIQAKCSCYKSKADVALLAQMSDKALTALANTLTKNVELTEIANAATTGFEDPDGNKFRYNADSGEFEMAPAAVGNADPDEDDDDGDDDGISANADPDDDDAEEEEDVANADDEEEEETEAPVKNSGKKVVKAKTVKTTTAANGFQPIKKIVKNNNNGTTGKANRKTAPAKNKNNTAKTVNSKTVKLAVGGNQLQLTQAQIMELMPSHVRQLVDNHRNDLVDRILANCAEENREQMTQYIANKDTEELELLANLNSGGDNQESSGQTYIAPVGVNVNGHVNSRQQPLGKPAYDWQQR